MIKKVFSVLLLSGFCLFLNTDLVAQTPWLSKDVQKVANKKQLEKEERSNSNIQAVSQEQTWVVSKGISTVGRTETESEGNIQSNGIPQVAISKGVHQAKPKKVLIEEQEEIEMRPSITGSNK